MDQDTKSKVVYIADFRKRRTRKTYMETVLDLLTQNAIEVPRVIHGARLPEGLRGIGFDGILFIEDEMSDWEISIVTTPTNERPKE